MPSGKETHPAVPAPATPAREGAYTVSELAGRIKTALAGELPSMVWVTGEVANLTRSKAGHVYLDLVERDRDKARGAPALLHSVIWESRRHAINHALIKANWGAVSDGDQIKARVRVDFYPPQGRLILRIHEVDPSYSLEKRRAERERVVALLKKEGIVERNKRLPLSPAPHRVGLVTSADTNAHADFISTLSESGLGWQVLFHHSGVQGDAARSSLVEALGRLSALGPDAICIVRGGGSATDLAVFDHEEVARAIAGASAPVITGIGHELDRTVSDLVAHRSERTPTACASWLVGRVRNFAAQVDRSGRQIAEAADGQVTRHRRLLEGSPAELSAAVGAALARCRQRLGGSAQMLPARVRPRLRAAEAGLAARRTAVRRESKQGLKRERDRLEASRRIVEAYDPQRNLARGWSITRRPGGGVIGSVLQVSTGDTIETWLADGTVTSTVSDTRRDRGTGKAEEVTEP